MELVCPASLYKEDPELALALWWSSLERALERRRRREERANVLVSASIDVDGLPPKGMLPACDVARELGIAPRVLNYWARTKVVEARKYKTQRESGVMVRAWHVWPDKVREELKSGRHPQIDGRKKKREKTKFLTPPEGMRSLPDMVEELGVHKDTLKVWIRKGKIYGKKYHQWRGPSCVLTWFVWPEEARALKR